MLNVLSLFDGMAGGLEALKRTQHGVNKYYASEIDKWAMQVAKKNHPEIIHLGDVQNWREWDIEKPDIIIGGSPCQGFSKAGMRLNFDDERSKLFFTFVDILNYHKPKYFLLENVKMKEEWSNIITSLVGVPPIRINSNLVSAQNRDRLYWTNIPTSQPKDKGIMFADIIEDGFVDREKSLALVSTYYKGPNPYLYFKKSNKQIVLGGAIRNYKNEDGIWKPLFQTSYIQKSNAITAGGRDTHLAVFPKAESYRRLTPVECERLQTYPDGYSDGCSNTQRFKMLGNSFTVDVIAHILSGIGKEETEWL